MVAVVVKVVRISFISFFTQQSSDVVHVFDGLQASGRTLMVKLSGQYYSPIVLTSTQRYLYVVFTTDSNVADHGFKAIYTTTNQTG